MSPALIMAGIAATALLGGAIILARRATTPQGVYARRIAGTMALAAAIILALFAWGLHRVGG